MSPDLTPHPRRQRLRLRKSSRRLSVLVIEEHPGMIAAVDWRPIYCESSVEARVPLECL